MPYHRQILTSKPQKSSRDTSPYFFDSNLRSNLQILLAQTRILKMQI
ncbi:hypothetical protein CSUNSWCD_30 [Campylobacter showae CSUNSWCD]|uniref:Uncharacterized protein n=1 Tax=Campylobacter showae CSUNSWCD TaxID=1244083 RepID=M5ILL8_9BACT|nr:hypothetical protein CSUNSWCD_30 [Campylobacter showae CSUNSWCD]